MILGDLNCKVGNTIEGNKDEITKGGKLLLKLMKKYKMKMINAEECCEGLWTRIEGDQKSILDYVLVFEEDVRLVRKMEIDDSRDITPYYIEKTNGKMERKYTDHFMITTAWNMSLLAEKNKTYIMI